MTVSPGRAWVGLALLVIWSCGGGGGEMMPTVTLLLATPLGTSALRTWAMLLILPAAAAAAWTWTRQLVEDLDAIGRPGARVDESQREGEDVSRPRLGGTGRLAQLELWRGDDAD